MPLFNKEVLGEMDRGVRGRLTGRRAAGLRDPTGTQWHWAIPRHFCVITKQEVSVSCLAPSSP